MDKLLIIGGKGTIGSYLTQHFSTSRQVITAGRNSGEFTCDIADAGSIQSMFEKIESSIGKMDAVICAAGEAKWASFQDLHEQDYFIGIKSKLMGQVNLVRIGSSHLNPNASITLSTGILADQPVPMTASAAMVNGAIHSFVLAASLELKDIRLNVVSAGLVEDSEEKYRDYFPGHTVVKMPRVADAFAQSVDGKDTGQIIRVY